MKTIYLLLFLAITGITSQAQNINFNTYFTPQSMRLDYIHAGNYKTENIFLQEIKKESFWAGSKTQLIDTFRYGEYWLEIITQDSNKIIYSRGYNTLFQEWKTYPEAKKILKSFYETVCFPYPKNRIKLQISKRIKGGKYQTLFNLNIDPDDFMIKKERAFSYKTFQLLHNGSSDKKLDIVFLFDGYTLDEKDKMHQDAIRFSNYLWSYEPFKSYKKDFNIWGVETFSEESGTDIPGDNLWKNTLFNTSFYTFRTERYLTTQDVKSIRDAAALVPYDQIYIIVNTDKYGGGGIYNFWNLVAADNPLSKWVFLHEFGHGFAGLADEYVDKGISEDFYEKDVEPWEPNITNRVTFDSKWKNKINKNTPIPTPEKEVYKNTIGLFEGAGYVEKGVYRPTLNCEMRALKNGFCPICSDAIIRMILFYSR